MPKSKVWFITGTSSGFGRELAKIVLANGDRLVATSRNPDDLVDIVGKNDNALAAQLDVTKPDLIEHAVQQAMKRFGRIDVLVNNAGFGSMGAIEEVEDVAIRKQFDVNVFGLLKVTQAVLPVMREQRSGHILMLSSVGGRVAVLPGFGIYCGTKFAVEGISATLAQEVEPFGIKVILIEPGAFNTDFGTRSLETARPLDAYESIMKNTREFLGTEFEKVGGDPAKAAKAMYELVSVSDPPLRQPLGADSFEAIRKSLHNQLDELNSVEAIARAANESSNNPSLQ